MTVPFLLKELTMNSTQQWDRQLENVTHGHVLAYQASKVALEYSLCIVHTHKMHLLSAFPEA